MVHSNKLKGEIVAKGFTEKVLAKKIGISATSLNYKINNKREFTLIEWRKLMNVLAIPIAHYGDYFFSNK